MRLRSTAVRSVSLDSELALWVEQRAAEENRSVSNFVNTLLGRLRDRAKPPAPAAAAASGDAEPPPAGRQSGSIRPDPGQSGQKASSASAQARTGSHAGGNAAASEPTP